MAHLPGDLGNELHGSGAGSNHSDTLAGQIHPFLGPTSRVAPRALEVVDAFEVRHVVGRQQAHGSNKELPPSPVAILHRQLPASGLLVVYAGDDAGVEADVTAQVELVGYVVQVAFVLGLAGIQFLPIPLLEKLFGEGIAVGVALGVKARTGVAVPVPGPSDAGGVLE